MADWKEIITTVAVVYLVLGFSVYLAMIGIALCNRDGRLYKMIFGSATHNIGLPTSALTAFAIVIAWGSFVGDKPSKFEVPGFKFEGVATPTILWVVVYLALVTSMRIAKKS